MYFLIIQLFNFVFVCCFIAEAKEKVPFCYFLLSLVSHKWRCMFPQCCLFSN